MQACWVVGLNSRAVALAQEGLTLVGELSDREAEACLAALLAMSLREEYRSKVCPFCRRELVVLKDLRCREASSLRVRDERWLSGVR